MSKFFLSFVALLFSAMVVFADNEQWQSPAYEAIGDNATGISSLDSTNGSWDEFAENSAFFEATSKTLELNLEDDEQAQFTVAENTQEDTNTFSRVSITAKFSPLESEDEFMTGAELEADGAQVAFAVYNGKYFGWAGGNNWVELSGTPSDDEVTLVVELAYWQDTPQAKFSIGSEVLGTIDITSTAVTVGRVAGCSFFGYGDVKTVNGELQLGVAEYNGRKYATANDAISAANVSGGEVKLLQSVDGDVNQVGANVKLDMNGQKVSGDVQVARGSTLEVTGDGSQTIDLSNVKVATGDSGTVKLRLTSAELANGSVLVGTDADNTDDFSVDADGADPTKQYVKEVDGSNIKIRVETADSVVTAIVKCEKAMTHSSTLKTFLSKYDDYNNANSTTAKVSAILDTVDSGNSLTRFQEYVLGVEADSGTKVFVQPPVTGDTDTGNVTLTFPMVNPPADSGYTVKYMIGDTEYDSPSAAKLPLDSANGAYPMKIVVK